MTEKCGKGFRISSLIECDDGNNIDGDGCSSDCKVEAGYVCEGGSSQDADVCTDATPITFSLKESKVEYGTYKYQVQFSKRLSQDTMARLD